jgi:tetratricopeptide (TPR) repeat protein
VVATANAAPNFDVLQRRKEMKKITTLGVILSLLVAGCGKPTIDTSSDENMKESIEKVKTSLPDEQKDDFEEALQIVAFSGIDLSDFFATSQADTGATERKMKESLNGKTGEQVIKLAASIKAKREAERLKKEEEQKAKAAQILLLAEELREEDDYTRALDRYEEARIYDPENVEIKGRIAELERIIKEKREKEIEKNRKVRELLSSARDMENDGDLLKALNTYREALALDGDSEAAVEGIRETKEKIADFKEKQTYLEKIDLYDFEASTIDSYLEKNIPAVKFKLKNNGDRVLSEVEVTVYLKDENDRIIAEEDFYPVLVSNYSFSGDNKPLKAGYIWELERGKWYTIKDAPTEWEVGNAEAKITNIEFKK